MKPDIDKTLKEANPVRDHDLAGFDVDDAASDLLSQITTTPMPEELADSPVRSRRVLTMRRLAPLAGAGALIAVTFVVVQEAREPSQAWSDEMIEMAELAPRVLIDHPDAQMDGLYQESPHRGSLDGFIDGSLTEFEWAGPDYYSRRVQGHRRDGMRGEQISVMGTTGTLFTHGDTRFEALWRLDGHSFRLVADLGSRAAFDEVLNSLKVVDVDAWLSTMPEGTRLAYDYSETTAEFVDHVPLPKSIVHVDRYFGSGKLNRRDVDPDDHQEVREQLAGMGACLWVRQWFSPDKYAHTNAEVAEGLDALYRWARQNDAVNDNAEWDYVRAILDGSHTIDGEPIDAMTAGEEIAHQCGGW